MELEAILYALQKTQNEFKNENCEIYCDSAYCVNICNGWIKTWAANNWTRGKGEEIKNLDIIKKIYNYIKIDFPNYIIKKCDGHSGDSGNEIADALATNNEAKFAKFLEKVNRDILVCSFIDFI